MKTLELKKDFLRYGLNEENAHEGKYQANDKSAFSGTYFKSKKEASDFWTKKFQDFKKFEIIKLVEGDWMIFKNHDELRQWENQT